MKIDTKQLSRILAGTTLVLTIGLISALSAREAALAQVSTLEKEVGQQNVRVLDYEDILAQKEEQLNAHKEFIRVLREQSTAATYSFSYMQNLIEEATQAVTDIKKLEEADRELLAKYSKVFFLNEHYTPKNPAYIPSQWVLSSTHLQVAGEVLPFLTDMLSIMQTTSLTPRVVSAFRSYEYQSDLKGRNTVTYGADTANQFVADQGYSEHQLGTTIDVVSTDIGSDLLKFDSTDEYKWLVRNAYQFGFVLSYPENNTYYEFEPWHWRFVGVELATFLHEQNKYFYDLTQREIDTYRLDMFTR